MPVGRAVVLDPTDKRILRAVQEDATISMQALADRVGLTANPCWRRLKRLEAEGVIQRRIAVIDAASVGLRMTAFVGIRISRHDGEWLGAFAAAVRNIAEIVECHRVSGELDYLLKAVVEDVAHYDRVYQRLISMVPGLIDVSTSFSMERLKETFGIDVSTIPEG
jgi:Lrp/AsnC family transcriptional regulator